MIGAFARMLGSRSRVMSVENDHTVRSQGSAGYAEHAAATDAPPEAFVEKLSDEGGDVYVMPFLDVLRASLRRARDPSKAEPKAATADQGTGTR